MKTKLAKQLSIGDTVMVDLGMGKVARPVDQVRHQDDKVTVVFYTEHGRRPQLTIPATSKVEVAEN